MEHIGQIWEVYYSERGIQQDLKIFNSEELACEFFYCIFLQTILYIIKKQTKTLFREICVQYGRRYYMPTLGRWLRVCAKHPEKRTAACMIQYSGPRKLDR